MLTATRIGAVEASDVVELLPALVSLSTNVSAAIDKASSTVIAVGDRLAALPGQFVHEAKAGVQEISYTAGRGFGRGVGWGVLPPVLIGFGAVLAGLLVYRYAATRIDRSAGLEPVAVSGQAFLGQLR